MIYDVPLEASLDHVATWCVFYPFGPMQWDGQFIVTPFIVIFHLWYAHDQEHAFSGPGVNISLNYQANHGIQTCYPCCFRYKKRVQIYQSDTQKHPAMSHEWTRSPKLWSLVPVCLPRCWRILNHVPEKLTMSKNVLRESEFRITSECLLNCSN